MGFLLPKKDSKSSEIGRCEDVNTSVELRWHQRLPFLIDFRLHCWCFRYPAANPLRLEIYFTIYDMFEPHPRSGYSIFPVLKPWNWQILPEISIWTGLQPSSCSLVPASHGLCGIIPNCVQKRRFPNPRYFQYYLDYCDMTRKKKLEIFRDFVTCLIMSHVLQGKSSPSWTSRIHPRAAHASRTRSVDLTVFCEKLGPSWSFDFTWSSWMVGSLVDCWVGKWVGGTRRCVQLAWACEFCG